MAKDPEPIRVTQKDIARVAGVSHVTVSLALRNRREIPVKTRQRIHGIAEKMGYSPDPMLKALAAYRRRQRPLAFQANLAWLINFRDPGRLFNFEDFQLYFQGAKTRAAELGYGVEIVNLVEYEYNGRAVQKMLAARGIEGILVSPVENFQDHIDLDWSRYSAVRFGYSMRDTLLHTVTNAQYRSAFLAMENLKRLGYRRIGCMIGGDFNERTGGHFLGGYLSARTHLRLEEIPPFMINEVALPDAGEPFWDPTRFWLATFQPDVILAHAGYFSPYLQKWGYRVPEDIGLASLSVEENEIVFSGVHQNARSVGRAATDLLVALIDRQETGIPDIPMHVLIEGVWRDGHTTRPPGVESPIN